LLFWFSDVNEYVQEMQTRMNLAHEIARKTLKRKTEYQKRYYDTKSRKRFVLPFNWGLKHVVLVLSMDNSLHKFWTEHFPLDQNVSALVCQSDKQFD
jgi:hypothetical protein